MQVASSHSELLRGYAICTAPRAGSNFLGQVLTSTGVLGRPLEYFNAPARRAIEQDPTYPDDPREQVERILTTGATSNGVYGLKIFPSQHDAISARVRWSGALPGLQFVHLERRDLLGQAISWWRAEQTSQYRSSHPARAQASFVAEEIERCLRAIVREQGRWDQFFARNDIQPLRLVYEDLVLAPLAAAEAIAKMLNIREQPCVDLAQVDLVVQRDTVSEEWRARFVAERRNLDVIDAL
jgi:LPS sulfotransferase NodH